VGVSSASRFRQPILSDSPNNLLTRPLVSPVNLGSLGVLCPLMIGVSEVTPGLTADGNSGGGELLRDEVNPSFRLPYLATEPRSR